MNSNKYTVSKCFHLIEFNVSQVHYVRVKVLTGQKRLQAALDE